MKSVTAVLVTYNSADVIAQAIASLLMQLNIERIIVVDNASQDTTCALIAERFPSVALLRNEQNLGYGAANNVALAQVETPYVLMVNPDATLEEGALSQLLKAAGDFPDAGILAPRLRYDDGGEQPSHKNSLFQRARFRAPYIAPEGDLCADFLSGAVWLVRMDALRKVGFFDPNIFFYYEDDDLGLRMRAGGYGLVLVNDARATHGMGKSSPPSAAGRRFRLYHVTWSRLYIEYKYRGLEAARRMGLRNLRRYRWRLWLGQSFLIGSLTRRYQPRLLAVQDFMAMLPSLTGQ